MPSTWILLFILLFFLLLIPLYRYLYFKLSSKPILWRYWEILPGENRRPGYIDLCYASHDLHCSRDFRIISLHESNIYFYLPYLKGDPRLQDLPIQQRVDYYRYHLLRDYGGVWIDADILTLKSLKPIYEQLETSTYDYYGFGCGLDPPDADKGKYHPTNWLMMSKKGGRFITHLCRKVDDILESASARVRSGKKETFELEYHGIGKDALHATMVEIRQMDPDWDYLHFPSRGQEFDRRGNKLNHIFQPFDTFDPANERYFFPLYHTAPGYPSWFQDLKKEDFFKQGFLESKGVYLTPILQKAFPSMKSTP